MTHFKINAALSVTTPKHYFLACLYLGITDP